MNSSYTSMQSAMLDAFAHPSRAEVFYSANGALTGSDKLNSMPVWDWSANPVCGVAGVSTCMFPLALGCRPVITSNGGEWIAPCISDPAQVKKLVIPDVWEGRTGTVLQNIERLLAELPAGMQIREPDIQSPLGIAELLWDDSFYFSLLEYPHEVHALLQKITDFVVAFIREVQRLTGTALNAAGFPPIWADHHGTMVADDTMSLISPAMHLEFSVPYLNQIADSVGPLFYHSCTWRARYFDNIHQIRNVRAYNWNPGNSDDPALIIREFSGKAVLAPHICRDMHCDNDLLAFGFTDEAALLEYMLDAMQSNTSLHFWFSNVVQNGPVIERMYHLLHARGYSPQAKGFGLRTDERV